MAAGVVGGSLLEEDPLWVPCLISVRPLLSAEEEESVHDATAGNDFDDNDDDVCSRTTSFSLLARSSACAVAGIDGTESIPIEGTEFVCRRRFRGDDFLPESCQRRDDGCCVARRGGRGGGRSIVTDISTTVFDDDNIYCIWCTKRCV